MQAQTDAATVNLLTGRGIDEYLTRTDADGRRTFLTDALGSTIALTDDAGAVVTEYTYDPFGATTTSGTPSANPFQYTGREHDGATGLYHYRTRYYSPTLHRFLSEDRLEIEPWETNLYAYVGNDPLGFVDPYGETTTAAQLVAFGMAILAAIFFYLLQILADLMKNWAAARSNEGAPATGPAPDGHDDTGKDGGAGEPQSKPRAVPERGLPPEGVLPPDEGPFTEGPASRPSEQKKGGKSLWTPKGHEWRYFPGDRWHNPHWDFNPWDRGPNTPWRNVPIDKLPIRKGS